MTGFLDGTKKEPDKEWNKKSSQAAVLLLNSIDLSQRLLFINCRTTKAIWDKIQELFSNTRENLKDDAYEKFHDFRFAKGIS